MDIKNILIVLIGMVHIFMGVLLLFKKEKKISDKWFFGLILSLISWCITMIFYRISGSVDSSIIWAILLYESAILIPFTFLFFSIYFPYGKSKIKRSWQIVIFIPTLILIFFVSQKGLVINEVILKETGEKVIKWGSYYIAYNFYIVLYFTLAFIVLFKKFLQSSGIVKTQIKFILFGTLIASLFGNISNLMLPTFDIFTFNWFGQVASVVMSIFIFYAISRHNLMNVKVIATEIFTGALWMFAAIRVITSPNIEKVIQNSVLFIAVFFIGILLIRSANRLVEQREKAENLAEDLKYANEQLRKINEREKEFLSFASHQLKSPLSSIKGYTSLIIEGTFGEISGDVKDAVRKMFVSANSMNRSVNDFLNVSRIEQGRLEYKITTFDFLDLVKSITTGITTKILKNNINFVSNFDNCGSVCMIEADKEKTEQIIGNVINGIIQYSNNKEVEDIHLDIFKNENCAILSIKSLNMNISQEKLFGLFQKYSEEIEESENNGQKIGLGFYVAKEMMMRQNGKLDAQVSENSNEVTFSLEFPLA